MTKKEFVDIINFIKAQKDKEDKLCAVLDLLSPETQNDCFIYAEYEAKLVQLLNECLGLKDDTLEWWLYDTQFGEDKIGRVVEYNDKKYEIKTADELYDYIKENK